MTAWAGLPLAAASGPAVLAGLACLWAGLAGWVGWGMTGGGLGRFCYPDTIWILSGGIWLAGLAWAAGWGMGLGMSHKKQYVGFTHKIIFV